MRIAAFDPARKRLATRLVFCLAGICLGAWAPLVPLAKQRLQVDEGTLGLLLLCMGVGSIAAMPLTAHLTSRFGCRRIIPAAVAGLVVLLPLLATMDTVAGMCVALLACGMFMGTNSVAMNLQAVLVEGDAGKPLMSGFHAMFSLGGILGSGFVTLLLAIGITSCTVVFVTSIAVAALLLGSLPGLLPYRGSKGERTPAFAAPKGVVLFISFLGLLAMLAEGGILDWGALFLVEGHRIDPTLAGLGYTGFTAAMTCGRLSGDFVRARCGDPAVLTGSSVLACFGFLVSLTVPGNIAAIAGFILIGAGLANVVPILFTLTGKTKVMPANLAVSAVLSVGYAGIIAGPGLIGLVADLTNVHIAFGLLCCAMAIVAASAKPVSMRVLTADEA